MSGLRGFLLLSVRNFVILLIDWAPFQLLLFISAYLNDTELVVFGIMYYILTLFFSFIFGICNSLVARISILLSFGRFGQVSILTKFICVFVVLIGFIFGGIAFVLGHHIGALFVHTKKQAHVLDKLDDYIWFLWILIVFEYFYSCMHCVLRALGKHKLCLVESLFLFSFVFVFLFVLHKV